MRLYRTRDGLCGTDGCPGPVAWLATNLPVASVEGPDERWAVGLCAAHGREVEAAVVAGELACGDVGPLGCVLLREER